jgi:hypothetical protein
MTTKEQREQENNLREHNRKITEQERETFRVLIAEQVMHSLGEPKDLIMVQVRWLWEDRYRVNVFVGAAVTSAQIVNSYFLIVDSNAKIMTATPSIIKQY